MKKSKKYLFTIFLVFHLNFCFAKSEFKSNEFYSNSNEFIKVDSLDCKSHLFFDPSGIALEFIWICDKGVQKKQLTSSQKIVHSIAEIIEEFNLKKNLEKVEFFYVNVGWRTSHWPLYEKINNDFTWSFGPSKHHSEDKSDKKKRYMAYEQRIRELLLSQEVYGPIVSQLESFGCKVTLPKYFADPLYDIESENMTKTEMIKYKVFTENEAKHDFYPYFKGAITFEVDCKK